MVDPFEYIPPNEITGPKHFEINAAHKACCDTFGHVLTGAPWLGEHAGHYDPQVAHDSIKGAARAFFRTVQTYAPPSADRAAAERCVRLARMHANEAIRSPSPTGAADSTRRAFDALADARLQANAAIALESAQAPTQREPVQVAQ